MRYQCSVCHEEVAHDLLKYIDHTEAHIIDEIKSAHPEWKEKEGLCPKCIEYYKREMKQL